MAQEIAGAGGAIGAVPPTDGKVPLRPLVNIGVLDRAGVRAAVQAAAPVAGAPVAPVAGALFPQGLVPARFDVDGVLLGPLPTKSNGSCKLLPKIPGETWP